MKRKLAIVLCFALLVSSLVFSNAMAANAPDLSLITTGTHFNPGAIIPVQVKLTDATSNNPPHIVPAIVVSPEVTIPERNDPGGIYVLEASITFDPNVFTIATQVTSALQWLDTNYLTAGIITPNTATSDWDVCSTVAGVITVKFSSLTPINTDGVLFTINFHVKAAPTVGSTNLTWQSGGGSTVLTYDYDANELENTAQDLSVMIDATTTTEAAIVDVPMAQSQITTTLVGENLTITVDNASTNYNYQFWSMQKVSQDLVDASNVALYNWVKVGGFSATKTVSFSSTNTTDADGNYQIMVRVVKTGGTFVGQFVDVVTQVQAGVVGINTVLVKGKATTGNEYFKNTDGPVLIKINAVNAVSYSLAGCNATQGNAGEFTLDISAYAPGRYALTAIALGSSTQATKVILLNIYEAVATESYPVVAGLSATQGTEPQKIVVNASGSAVDGTQYMFMLAEPNRAATQNGGYLNDSSKTFTLSSQAYGHYLLSAYARRSAAANYDDGMITTYNFARPGVPVTVDAVVTGSADFNNVTLGETISFVATGTIPGLINGESVQYSFWRNDANGFTLFKDWANGNGSNTLTWKPTKAGKYSIQVRVKGSVAGSYEAVKNFNFTVNGDIVNGYMSTLSAEDITVEFYNVSTGAKITGSLPARTPVEVRATVPAGNDLYYKYIVTDAQLGGYQISAYSPDNTVIWSPRKATNFTVKVFARSYDSFGTADVIKSVNVTAE